MTYHSVPPDPPGEETQNIYKENVSFVMKQRRKKKRN